MGVKIRKAKVKEITRPVLRQLREEIDAALAGVAQNHGLQIKSGNASYTPNNATVKVEIAVIGAEGKASSKEAEAFKAHCFLYNMPEEALNSCFTYRGFRYTLVGMAPRSRKYPFIAVRVADNKRFKVPFHAVKSLANDDA